MGREICKKVKKRKERNENMRLSPKGEKWRMGSML
jgi:hypothetical protein